MSGVTGHAVFLHYLIVDGRLAGTWAPEGVDRVAVRPHARLTPLQQAAVDRAVRRYLTFIRVT
jgi:hypothetical protein